jgi:hypothetical protein
MDIRLTLAGDAAAAISIPFVVLLLGWVVATMGRVRIARLHSEVWSQLVDRLDAESVSALLASGNGRALDAILNGPERPHARIIAAAQGAVVLLVLGAVLLGYSLAGSWLPTALGAVVAALGAGLAGAAGVGYWLSARWGLLPRDDTPRRAA